MTTSFVEEVLVESDKNWRKQFLRQFKNSITIKDLHSLFAESRVNLSTISTPGKYALRSVLDESVDPGRSAGLIVLGAAFGALAMTAADGASGPGSAAVTAAAVASATPACASHGDCTHQAEYWLDLSEPALSCIGHDETDQRAALGTRIDRQQTEVLARVRELSGKEVARMKELRNAVAVTLPVQAAVSAGRNPGVLRVRPVQHRHRVDD